MAASRKSTSNDDDNTPTMTDADLATRSPENDYESEGPTMDSIALDEPTATLSTADTTAAPPPQPPVSEHCTTDRPLSSSSSKPVGDISPIASIPCYITKPASYPSDPSKLLLLLSSGTGHLSINNQLQADLWAQQGYVVVMPDQFAGDPAPNSANTNTETGASSTGGGVVGTEAGSTDSTPHAPSIIERVKLGIAETAKSFAIDMWLARHTPATVLPRLRKVIEGCHEQFADAIANGGGIYSAGYCFGAKYTIMLLGANAAEDGQPLLKVGAIAHPTLVTQEDMHAVRRSLCMILAKDDPMFPDSMAQEIKIPMRQHDLKDFDGYQIRVLDAPHGFAVVGEYADEKIVEAQKEAFDAMKEWLESH
jgi:dienelactone hydrolase